MNQRNLPPIIKLAERFMLACDIAVRGFSRYHKYTFGTQLREEAMALVKQAYTTWQQPKRQLAYVTQLLEQIDNLKITLQIGKTLKVYKNFAQFEALSRMAVELGKQCGGWLKHLQKANPQPHTTLN